MEKRYQVFVSSTYADLKEERQKVIQTLMEMDCIPAGMELFPAADDEQWNFIKSVINDCDYYILIIGGRYGSITNEGVSYTEKEYEYAKERGLKVLAFIHEKPDEIVLIKSEIDPNLRTSLNAFREKASNGRLVKFWSAAKELPGLVALSLTKTIKAYPAVGWVRADKVANLDLLEELNILRKQNHELEKQIKNQKNIFSESEVAEFEHIWTEIDSTAYITIMVKSGTETSKYDLGVNFRYIYSKLTEIYTYSFKGGELSDHMLNLAKVKSLIPNEETLDANITFNNLERLVDDLVMYGFVEPTYIPPQPDIDGSTASRMRSWLNAGRTEYTYTSKMHRFKYWLAYNKLLPESCELLPGLPGTNLSGLET